jgi:DNA-directed RNA polymerase specialized sigma24 family protein
MPDAISMERRGEPVREEAGEGASRPDSFAALVERQSQFVFRIALAVTRDPRDAEDVVQETFLQVCRGDRWKRMEDERGCLARVAWRLLTRPTSRRLCWRDLAQTALQAYAPHPVPIDPPGPAG